MAEQAMHAQSVPPHMVGRLHLQASWAPRGFLVREANIARWWPRFWPEQDDERLTEEPLNQQSLLQVRWRTRPAAASGSRDESAPGGAKKMLEVSDDEGSCRNGGLLQALKDTVHIMLRALAAARRYETLRIASDPDPCRAGIDAQRCAPRRVPNADRWLVTSLGQRA